MTGSLAEHGQVEFGHRIGGQHVQLGTRGQRLERLARAPDRFGAVEPATIELLDSRFGLVHV